MFFALRWSERRPAHHKGHRHKVEATIDQDDVEATMRMSKQQSRAGTTSWNASNQSKECKMPQQPTTHDGVETVVERCRIRQRTTQQPTYDTRTQQNNHSSNIDRNIIISRLAIHYDVYIGLGCDNRQRLCDR